AARLRDDLQALQRALEKQAVVLPDGTNCDVIGLVEDQLEAAVQVFYVRDGRVRGQRGWVVDKVEDLSTGELVEHFLGQVYRDDPVTHHEITESTGGELSRTGGRASADWRAEADQQAVPREVLVPVLPPDAETVSEWLAARRGGRVSLRVPQRGDKRALLETVTKNATEALALHKTKRASDLSTRSQAMQEIQDALGLDTPPLRIECIDVSNLQGTHVVASMVVFEDGLARKSEYRKFAIRGATDDLAAIYEVVTRRFRRYLAERDADVAADPERTDLDSDRRKFAYPPSLLVIDGGAGQVDAAIRALADLGITDIAVCGLAKRLEEVWLPGEDSPVIMPRSSEGLYLLQRVRDEAHRFAITYHRAKRTAAQRASQLDGLPGLGPARKAALLKHFGSVRKLREASAEQIAEVEGFGSRLAEMVSVALQTEGGSDDQPRRRA
ncbi:MAG TPA: excinuclease ABC subunit UvrC, partial [Streptosporangiaceae bacterium]